MTLLIIVCIQVQLKNNLKKQLFSVGNLFPYNTSTEELYKNLIFASIEITDNHNPEICNGYFLDFLKSLSLIDIKPKLNDSLWYDIQKDFILKEINKIRYQFEHKDNIKILRTNILNYVKYKNPNVNNFLDYTDIIFADNKLNRHCLFLMNDYIQNNT